MLNNGKETNRCFIYLQLYIAYLFAYLSFGKSGMIKRSVGFL